MPLSPKKLLCILLLLVIISCDNKSRKIKKHVMALPDTIAASAKNSEIETGKKTSNFSLVKDFPQIKDSLQFISQLLDACALHHDPGLYEKITAYKKVKLYGSAEDYIFLEYDYGDGCTAAFPYKYQLLFSTAGKRIACISAIHYDFVEMIPNTNPFLLTLSATGHGNGGHEIYKVTQDTIVNILDGFFDYFPKTYDRNHDNTINEPFELNHTIKDYNNDGYNDIAFYGKVVLIQGRSPKGDWYDGETKKRKSITYSEDNPFKKIPVTFIFLYNTQTGHFTQKEDYSTTFKW